MTVALLDHLRAAWFERLARADATQLDPDAAFGRAFLREAEAFVPEDLADAGEARAILEACADEAARAALSWTRAAGARPSVDEAPGGRGASDAERPALVRRLAHLRAATIALLDDDVLAGPPPFRRRLAAAEHARVARALFERFPDARRADASRSSSDPPAVVARALERAGVARAYVVSARVGAELDVALLDGRMHWIDPAGAYVTDAGMRFVARFDDETSWYLDGALPLDG
jgi:hypothetical protein